LLRGGYDFYRTYDIAKQKEHYIKSLRQRIADESEIDFNIEGQRKIERTKEINKIVEELDRLIINDFYLKQAQRFHHAHY
jgi:hypothetical protein